MISKLSISLPTSLEEYARSRVRSGGYGSISEYFRELVRIDRRIEETLSERDRRIRDAPLPVLRPDDPRYRAN